MLQLVQAYRYEDFDNNLLKDFFLSKVTQNKDISHTFFWYIKLEKDNKENLPEICEQYEILFDEFLERLEIEMPEVKQSLDKQLKLRERLLEISQHIKPIKGVENKKKELRKILGKKGKFNMTYFDPAPMPLDPSVEVCGVIPEKCSVFASEMTPLKLTFVVTEETAKMNNPRVDGNLYYMMFKVGDDVRQDQLVLQMIDLMDFLLKKINYDLKFTVYKVLAFSEDDGMVEFVPKCMTINAILQNYQNNIDMFLKEGAKKNNMDYNKVFETYLDSCAGYCVVTYLLAVGDRHLDNLLIDDTGHMFHVDFGFIFGKNPPRKSVMPPIRICFEMIQCMGGFKSPNYEKFLNKCVTAFKFLRNHAKYILNLFHLMIHAEIEDLKAEQSEEILNQMYQKFLPEIKDLEVVEKEFSKLIKESITAFFARVFDISHNIAQKFA